MLERIVEHLIADSKSCWLTKAMQLKDYVSYQCAMGTKASEHDVYARHTNSKINKIIVIP